MATESNVLNRDTPKGIGADGFADIPSSYTVQKFVCVNKKGNEIDIQHLTDSFSITEELFSAVLVLNVRIRDNINFFESFALNGEERIDLELTHTHQGAPEQKIKLSFRVKEYPNYKRTIDSPNVQEYNIVAISEFGFTSSLQRISRSVKGNPIQNIQKIFQNDLSVKTGVAGICSTVFDGIITTQTPLQAIEWLRKKAFDSEGSPFFVYSTISDDFVCIQPLSQMWSESNAVFRVYKYKQFLEKPALTGGAFVENSTRILDMMSQIKLDKLKQATSGGFGSTTNVTDVSSKTYSIQKKQFENIFSLSGVKDLFSKLKNISFGANKPAVSLGETPAASTSSLSINDLANYLGNPNAATATADNIAAAKSFYANMEAISHNVAVYGDFKLNPGKKISIEIPKAIPRQDGEDGEELDEEFSGEYIVAVVNHSFKGGIYSAKVKIIKDA